MHRLVQAQTFDIRPVERGDRQSRHLLLVGQGGEFDVLGAAGRLDALDQLGQRQANPRNDHRPAFDTAHAVDALFKRREFEQFVDVVDPGVLDQAFDRHRPRPGNQRSGASRRVGLVGAELVVVVVRGDVLVRRHLFVEHELRVGFCSQLDAACVGRCRFGKGAARKQRRQRGAKGPGCGGTDQRTALLEHVARRDLAGGNW